MRSGEVGQGQKLTNNNDDGNIVEMEKVDNLWLPWLLCLAHPHTRPRRYLSGQRWKRNVNITSKTGQEDI